jgi:hypothetical protein
MREPRPLTLNMRRYEESLSRTLGKFGPVITIGRSGDALGFLGAGSPHATPALPDPPESEVSSVPDDDGLRLDDDERRSPSGPDAREQGPEPAVGLREPHSPRPRALPDLQLMP